MKTVLRFLKPYKRKIALVLLFMILDAAGGLLIPTVTADIINYGVGGGDMHYILVRGAWLLAVSAAAGACALCGSRVSADFSAAFGRDLRCAVYDRTLAFSAADIEQFGTGSLLTRTLTDVSVVQQTAGGTSSACSRSTSPSAPSTFCRASSWRALPRTSPIGCARRLPTSLPACRLPSLTKTSPAPSSAA